VPSSLPWAVRWLQAGQRASSYRRREVL
jgi:hypothetical protein